MLTSSQNEQIKLIRSLYTKKGRREHNYFVLEGKHLLQEALMGNYPLVRVYYCPESIKINEDMDLLSQIEQKGIKTIEVSSHLLYSLADTESPQGWLGIASIPEKFNIDGDKVVIFDRLQDPGNVGTILRTGLAFGIDTFYFLSETVDPYAPKVVRASQGAVLKTILNTDVNWDQLKALMDNKGIPLYAAEPDGDLLPEDIYWGSKFGLVLGQEGQGVRSTISKDIHKVKIPLAQEVESLNVAIAAGILLYLSAKI